MSPRSFATCRPPMDLFVMTPVLPPRGRPRRPWHRRHDTETSHRHRDSPSAGRPRSHTRGRRRRRSGIRGSACVFKLTAEFPQSFWSEPLRCQERVPAGTLPSADSHEYSGPDHGQVRQLSDLRHSCVCRAIIRPARVVHGLLRRDIPVIRLDESDGNPGLHPLRAPLGYKAFGAILGCEGTSGHRVFDSDIFAHGSRVTPRWDCGYARKELQSWRGSFGGCALRSPVEQRLHWKYTRNA